MIKEKIKLQKINESPSELHIKAQFDLSSGVYEGHFIDFPLLPGVIQIQLVMELLSENTYWTTDTFKEIYFTGFNQVKFFNPVQPGSNVDLKIIFDESKKQIRFHYYLNNKDYSKGTITFDIAHQKQGLL